MNAVQTYREHCRCPACGRAAEAYVLAGLRIVVCDCAPDSCVLVTTAPPPRARLTCMDGGRR